MINEAENSEEFEKKAKILRVEPGDQNRAKPMKFETFFKERNGNWSLRTVSTAGLSSSPDPDDEVIALDDTNGNDTLCFELQH
ncbi:hypothetical protein NC652_015581 [Populus alba x Populus x berolinensis]|nr:hypothetical protein NC652_015581 [Populus alba x Populus x berolinensis]